jgi:hypothetical protein
MKTRFELRPGFEKDAVRLPEVDKALARAADNVADEARRLTDSDRYRYGIKAEVGDNEKGDPVGRVNAMWWASGFIEFGTSVRRPEAPLRQALDSAVKRAL